MQDLYTKNEFDEFIIQYIRESLKDKQKYMLVDNYEDDKWGYFLKLLYLRGMSGVLNSLKSKDDLRIRTDVKLHISKLTNENTISVRT